MSLHKLIPSMIAYKSLNEASHVNGPAKIRELARMIESDPIDPESLTQLEAKRAAAILLGSSMGFHG